jgi:hypothetical protein
MIYHAPRFPVILPLILTDASLRAYMLYAIRLAQANARERLYLESTLDRLDRVVSRLALELGPRGEGGHGPVALEATAVFLLAEATHALEQVADVDVFATALAHDEAFPSREAVGVLEVVRLDGCLAGGGRGLGHKEAAGRRGDARVGCVG